MALVFRGGRLVINLTHTMDLLYDVAHPSPLALRPGAPEVEAFRAWSTALSSTNLSASGARLAWWLRAGFQVLIFCKSIFFTLPRFPCFCGRVYELSGSAIHYSEIKFSRLIPSFGGLSSHVSNIIPYSAETLVMKCPQLSIPRGAQFSLPSM